MAGKLGQLGALLLAYTQMRSLKTLRTGDLLGPLRITAKQERELMSRMARNGTLAQVRRGLYLVPSRLPLGRAWTPSEALALNTLMTDKAARYQICGPSAFSRYGFDEQIPTRLFAYNNRLSGDRTIGAVALTLIKVSDARLGDTEGAPAPDGPPLIYSSRTRTLLDAVYDWSRFDSLPRAYRWIREELALGRVSASGLVATTIRYGNMGTIRRIGLLLDRLGVPEAQLRRLQRKLTPSTSLIPWVPCKAKRGRVNRRWGVIVNEQD